MKDFIHKSLLNAGSKDAVSNMLQGAAIGAGANTALGAVQGDFDIVGNATSGALLGAGGGAAMRHMGDKYSSAIANMRKQKIEGSDSFSINHFTHAIKEESDFMGNPEMMKRAQSFMPTGGKPAAAADAPEGGKINTGEASNAEKFRGRDGYVTDGDNVYKSTGKTKDMQMPTFNTFDAFGRKTSQGGGTIPMDMHRPVSPTEQATTLRADELRQEKKAASFADSAKNPVNMGNNVDSSYQPRKVSDIASKASERKQAVADQKQAAHEAMIAQKKAAGQSVRDARAANRNTGDSLVENSNSYKELLKESQEKKAAAQSLADEIKAGGYVPDNKGGWKLPGDPVISAQSAAGDIIAGVFRETGRGPVKKPTSFEGGTLRLPKKPIDSSDFKPNFKNGKYQHPQHKKVKKYQPE